MREGGEERDLGGGGRGGRQRKGKGQREEGEKGGRGGGEGGERGELINNNAYNIIIPSLTLLLMVVRDFLQAIQSLASSSETQPWTTV